MRLKRPFFSPHLPYLLVVIYNILNSICIVLSQQPSRDDGPSMLMSNHRICTNCLPPVVSQQLVDQYEDDGVSTNLQFENQNQVQYLAPEQLQQVDSLARRRDHSYFARPNSTNQDLSYHKSIYNSLLNIIHNLKHQLVSSDSLKREDKSRDFTAYSNNLTNEGNGPNGNETAKQRPHDEDKNQILQTSASKRSQVQSSAITTYRPTVVKKSIVDLSQPVAVFEISSEPIANSSDTLFVTKTTTTGATGSSTTLTTTQRPNIATLKRVNKGLRISDYPSNQLQQPIKLDRKIWSQADDQPNDSRPLFSITSSKKKSPYGKLGQYQPTASNLRYQRLRLRPLVLAEGQAPSQEEDDNSIIGDEYESDNEPETQPKPQLRPSRLQMRKSPLIQIANGDQKSYQTATVSTVRPLRTRTIRVGESPGSLMSPDDLIEHDDQRQDYTERKMNHPSAVQLRQIYPPVQPTTPMDSVTAPPSSSSFQPIPGHSSSADSFASQGSQVSHQNGRSSSSPPPGPQYSPIGADSMTLYGGGISPSSYQYQQQQQQQHQQPIANQYQSTQLQQATAQHSSTSRDLLNPQPQTIQITAVPNVGYAAQAGGPLVRLNNLYGLNNVGYQVNGFNNGFQNPWQNGFTDIFGRQVVMVTPNAERRQVDWSFWIWPIIAVISLPLVLGALFVPVFLKTIVILIQLLQSLGLLLPITSALSNQIVQQATGLAISSLTGSNQTAPSDQLNNKTWDRHDKMMILSDRKFD